jgi:hypothetical protein
MSYCKTEDKLEVLINISLVRGGLDSQSKLDAQASEVTHWAARGQMVLPCSLGLSTLWACDVT